MSTSRKILRVERRTCPHCDCLLSLKTFKTHKRRYFDAISGRWLKAIDELTEDSEPEPPCLHPEPIVDDIPGDINTLHAHSFILLPDIYVAVCSLDLGN